MNLILLSAGTTDYTNLAKTFNVISIIAFILAAICLAFAIFVFVKYKIPRLIGDLTGKTARKAVAQMRDANEKGGKKSFRPTPAAIERGTITKTAPLDTTSPTGAEETGTQTQTSPGGAQSVLSVPETAEISNETENLSNDTELLSNETEILTPATELLLNENGEPLKPRNMIQFKVLQNIVLIHTDEVI